MVEETFIQEKQSSLVQTTVRLFLNIRLNYSPHLYVFSIIMYFLSAIYHILVICMSMFITSAKMLILFVNNATNENTCIIRHFLRSQQMSDYGGYSIIRQFANPTFSSFPNECRIMQVPLYQVIFPTSTNVLI